MPLTGGMNGDQPRRKGTNMTEDWIERRVERMMDHLDRVYLNGGMTQDDYDKAVRDLDEWSKHEYRKGSWSRIVEGA